MTRPEDERERLVQKELNAGNSLRNGVEDNQLHQLTGGMNTKQLGLVILLLLIVIVTGWIIFH